MLWHKTLFTKTATNSNIITFPNGCFSLFTRTETETLFVGFSYGTMLMASSNIISFFQTIYVLYDIYSVNLLHLPCKIQINEAINRIKHLIFVATKQYRQNNINTDTGIGIGASII